MHYIILDELNAQLRQARQFLTALETFHPSVYLTDTDRILAPSRIRNARAHVADIELRLKNAEIRLNAGQLVAA